MDIKDLTPEHIQKAKACKTADELIALAKAEGVELTDDQLDKVSAAGVWEGEVTGYSITCGRCGGTFETNLSEPQYCQLCGARMYW